MRRTFTAITLSIILSALTGTSVLAAEAASEGVTSEVMREEEGVETPVDPEHAAPVEPGTGEMEETEEIPDLSPGRESYQPDEGISNEELFNVYVDEAFGIPNEAARKQKARKVMAGSRLSGTDSALYTYISGQLPLIASGDRTSTTFVLPVEDMGLPQLFWSAEELGVAAIVVDGKIATDAYNAVMDRTRFHLSKLIDALLADHPYLLYWYDKTSTTGGTYFTVTAKKSGGVYKIGIKGSITLTFPVAGEYAAGEYEVNPEVGQSVQAAAGNAAEIVSKYSGDDDFDKLTAYREEICALTAYNYAAISTSQAYGNPWQLIWVFDGDPDTKVVCEGYSKAFKYLCDQSEFAADIDCRTVTGDMNGGTGAGGHMWNIVCMDDECNYLVDVTNCDTGMIGSGGRLFLVGTEGSPEEGYTFVLDTGRSISYQYDEEILELWAPEELTLKHRNYCRHDFGEWEITLDPACEEAGTRQKTCALCGDVVEEEIEALGHDFGEWEITKETSCAEPGSRQRVCSRCEKVEVEEIEMLPHTYGEWATIAEPTPAEEGVKERICEACGHADQAPIPKLVKIVRANISELPDKVYTGSEITQSYTVVVGEETLEENVDYTAAYRQNTNVGTATLVIRGIGKYYGQATRTFDITQRKIVRANIAEIADRTYTGSAITPACKVVIGGRTLVKGTDYTVSYKLNKNVGTATLVVKGTGNYYGQATRTFHIVPKGTQITSASAGSKMFTLKWQKQDVQTTGYAIQLSFTQDFAKIQKTTVVTSPSKTSLNFTGLTSGKKYYVRIRTYTKLEDGTLTSSWSAVKSVTVK